MGLPRCRCIQCIRVWTHAFNMRKWWESSHHHPGNVGGWITKLAFTWSYCWLWFWTRKIKWQSIFNYPWNPWHTVYHHFYADYGLLYANWTIRSSNKTYLTYIPKCGQIRTYWVAEFDSTCPSFAAQGRWEVRQRPVRPSLPCPGKSAEKDQMERRIWAWISCTVSQIYDIISA